MQVHTSAHQHVISNAFCIASYPGCSRWRWSASSCSSSVTSRGSSWAAVPISCRRGPARRIRRSRTWRRPSSSWRTRWSSTELSNCITTRPSWTWRVRALHTGGYIHSNSKTRIHMAICTVIQTTWIHNAIYTVIQTRIHWLDNCHMVDLTKVSCAPVLIKLINTYQENVDIIKYPFLNKLSFNSSQYD